MGFECNFPLLSVIIAVIMPLLPFYAHRNHPVPIAGEIGDKGVAILDICRSNALILGEVLLYFFPCDIVPALHIGRYPAYENNSGNHAANECFPSSAHADIPCPDKSIRPYREFYHN